MLTTEGWGGSPPVGPHLPRHPRVPLAFSTSAVLGGPSNRMTWTFPPEGSDPQLKDLIPPPLSDWLLRETALAHQWGGGGGRKSPSYTNHCIYSGRGREDAAISELI